MKKILPWLFAVGSTTTNLNAQINNTQMGDWNITPKIIELFGTEIENGPGGNGRYEEAIHTKKIICGTDTVTISAIGYGQRVGAKIEGTQDALEKFGRKIDGNIDVERVISELFALRKEENANTYYYCPKPS